MHCIITLAYLCSGVYFTLIHKVEHCINVLFFCPGVVSREMFDSMQNAEIISTLTKEFNEVRKGKH